MTLASLVEPDQLGTAVYLVWFIGFLCILLAASMLREVDIWSILIWSFELAVLLLMLWILFTLTRAGYKEFL